MVLPGHLACGYLAALSTLAIGNPALPAEQSATLLVIGTLSGEIPDIDIGWSLFRRYILGKNGGDHRKYFTHGPLFWLIVSAAISMIATIVSSLFLQYLALILAFGTLGHFTLDSIDHGVMWLWPFSKRKFSLLGNRDESGKDKRCDMSYYWHFITEEYPKTTSFRLEFILLVIAVVTFML